MNGQTNSASLIHQSAFDGLTNPPCGIGRESKTALGVELLYRSQKAEVTLLNEI